MITQMWKMILRAMRTLSSIRITFAAGRIIVGSQRYMKSREMALPLSKLSVSCGSLTALFAPQLVWQLRKIRI